MSTVVGPRTDALMNVHAHDSGRTRQSFPNDGTDHVETVHSMAETFQDGMQQIVFPCAMKTHKKLLPHERLEQRPGRTNLSEMMIKFSVSHNRSPTFKPVSNLQKTNS